MEGRDAFRLARVPAAAIVLLGIGGVLHAAGWAPDAFDLDGEYNVPAIWSACLFAAAAVIGVAAGRSREAAERRAFYVVAALLAYFGIDELTQVHERINARLDFAWQVVYLPLGAAFAWATWTIVRNLGRSSRAVQLLCVATAAWVISQALEAFEFGHIVPGLVDETAPLAERHAATHSLAFYAMSIPEEVLEMAGTLLFAIAFATAVRRAARAPH